jgi:hypothetical protein
MTIKDITLTNYKNDAVLSAQCKLRKIGWDTIYFKINSSKQSYVCSDASPFAAALLLPAMKQGQDLIIKGSISRQLYEGMQQIMKEVLQWDIGLQAIRIRADALVEDTQRPSKAGSFFSGGVDSFYTYLKHREDHAKTDRVSSLILVNGFDINLRETDLWDITYKNIAAIASAEQIELLTVTTNLHELLEPILDWGFTHGGCLAAVGLMLRNEFHKIYIPSTHSEAEQVAWGSNLALDKHWATESITFEHDGSETTRVNKVISQIAKAPVALKYLRVCCVPGVTYNCGKCDKCLRTMVNLYIAGALDKAETLPHHIDIAQVAAQQTIGEDHGGPIFHNENLTALKERNLNPALQDALAASIKITIEEEHKPIKKIKGALHKLTMRAVNLDYAYAGGYVYALSAKLFGKPFRIYVRSVTDCRPLTLRQARRSFYLQSPAIVPEKANVAGVTQS